MVHFYSSGYFVLDFTGKCETGNGCVGCGPKTSDHYFPALRSFYGSNDRYFSKRNLERLGAHKTPKEFRKKVIKRTTKKDHVWNTTAYVHKVESPVL